MGGELVSTDVVKMMLRLPRDRRNRSNTLDANDDVYEYALAA